MPRFFSRHACARPELSLLILVSLFFNWLAPQAFAARKSSDSARLSSSNRTEQASRASTAAPEVQADFIRQISLKTNDIVYSPSKHLLYASVPSSAGASGNSITSINPVDGSIGSSVFIGSEPNKLALSDDGQTLYASLDGAYGVRRFDLTNGTAGQQFPLGSESFFGLYRANDLAVAPGNPNLVAISRYYLGTSPPEAGVAIYDNGVQLPKTGPGHIAGSDFLAFSASASKLYGGGYYGGLRKMTVDSTGVTVNTTTSFNVGARIKFDNGLVYSSSGQVINPDTETLLGTFNNVNTTAFVPDSSVGRAYYLTSNFSNYGTLTLTAFDINTYLPVGTLTITGVTGDPTTLVRWGANGLAFRTNGNQLYIIQTSLIPSAEPIPTPTPTPSPSPSPSPTPVSTFVRQLPLATNDLIYQQSTQTLYASVPSSAGANGNSVTAINPVSGAVGNSIFVGSEPNRLALSDDGQSMYVGLDGAAAVRRVNLSTQTAGLQFSLGNETYNGPYLPTDIAVMPGNPNTVAVARNFGTTAIYDNGIPRMQTAGGSPVQFGSATTLYTGSGPIYKLAVNANGLTQVSSTLSGSNGSIYFDNGLIYTSGGAVVDPEAGVVKGTFSGDGLIYGSLMAVDRANGRVFFLSSYNGWTLRSFDINTFLPIASVNIQGINGTPTSLVRWGTNGLAFRTSDKKVFLIETELVNSSVPVPTPTPTPSPTPTPTPAYVPTYLKRLGLPSNDLVYNAATQTIYASVPSIAGANGNSITEINPQSGTVGTSVFVGSEPDKMALADDGQTLYVNLDGASAVRRYNVVTRTPGLQFSVGAQRPDDLEAVPGSPQSLAVSRGISSNVAIFDDGVQRPSASSGNAYAIGPISFGASASTLYGLGYSSGNELVKFSVDSSGVHPLYTVRNLVYGADMKFAGGRIYSLFGRVADPEAQTLVGTFQVQSSGSGPMAIDASIGRAFFLTNNFTGSIILSAYDLNTFLPIGSVTLAGVSGTPTSLVRWGTNGLAFRTYNNFGPPGAASDLQTYLIQSALVSGSGTVPTGIQFNADKYSVYESIGTATITVSRNGDVSATTTVDYATSDGTANAGSDYTATSGTLTFAPGEMSKTISIPVNYDSIYEGSNETFNLTLSNASGGALLGVPSSVVVTITDSSSKPYIGVSSGPRVNETDSGTTTAAVRVFLSNATYQPVTFDYATGNGTATAGSDYVATSGTLTIPAGSTSATVNVPINGDTTIEGDETFFLNISNATNVVNISIPQGVVTIANDDFPPDLSITQTATPNPVPIGSDITYALTVKNNGTVPAASVVVTDNLPAATTFVSCSATNDGTCGGTNNNRTISFQTLAPGASASINLVAKVSTSTVAGTAIVNIAGVSYAQTDPNLSNNSATSTVTAANASKLQFTAANYSVAEEAGSVAVLVSRSGNTSGAVTVDYATSDASATQKSDYTIAAGTLQFAPGETTKIFNVLITDDAYVEGNETVNLTLSNPTGSGASLDAQSTATLTITDNDFSPSNTNPIDSAQFFVRQHYLDFLNREADADGLAYWSDQIAQCGTDENCINSRRIGVSAAYFIELEFQDTGSFVYRFYKASYGQRPSYAQFMPDRSRVVGGANLEAGKQAFANAWVQRAEFLAAYPASLSGTQFIDAMLQTVQLGSGVDLSGRRDALVSDFALYQSRARIVRMLADDTTFTQAEYNKAFVLMQYFGYLRRDPDEGGYLFWVDVLNNKVPNNYRGMVCAFLTSAEYQDRFSSVHTRNDQLCSTIGP